MSKSKINKHETNKKKLVLDHFETLKLGVQILFVLLYLPSAVVSIRSRFYVVLAVPE